MENPFNFKGDRGLSAFSVKHNVVMNFTYDLPWRQAAGHMRRLIGGWQIGGIVTLQTGTPFTPLTSFSRSRDQARSISDRPDLKPGAKANHTSGTTAGCAGVAAGRRLGTADLYYDPCVFTLPEPGTYGNVGRDVIVGPGFIGSDVTLVKSTPITERLKADFRFEAFNLLNRANLANPSPTNNIFSATIDPRFPGGTVLGSAGRIQATTSSSRQLQFGLKLLF